MKEELNKINPYSYPQRKFSLQKACKYNCFGLVVPLPSGPNTGIGHTSAIFIIEAQLLYIMKSIKKVLADKKQSIEVKAEVEQDYTTMIHEEMKRTVWKSGGCKSWYQSKSGHVIAMFPGFSFTFRNMANDFKPNNHIIS